MSASVIGVAGAGFMGTGIAESVAVAGKHAVLYEPEEGPLQRSRVQLRKSLDRAAARGKLTQRRPSRWPSG